MYISKDPNTLVQLKEVTGETTYTDTTIRDALNSSSSFVAPTGCEVTARFQLDSAPFAIPIFNLTVAVNFKRTDGTTDKLLSIVDNSQSIAQHIADGNTTIDGTVIPEANVLQVDKGGNYFLLNSDTTLFTPIAGNSILISFPIGAKVRRILFLEDMDRFDNIIRTGSWSRTSNNSTLSQRTAAGSVLRYKRPIFRTITANFFVADTNVRPIHDFEDEDPRRIVFFEEFDEQDTPKSKLMFGEVTISEITAISLAGHQYDTTFTFNEANIGG